MSGLMTESRERGLRDGGDDRSDAVAIGGEGNGPPGKIIFLWSHSLATSTSTQTFCQCLYQVSQARAALFSLAPQKTSSDGDLARFAVPPCSRAGRSSASWDSLHPAAPVPSSAEGRCDGPARFAVCEAMAAARVARSRKRTPLRGTGLLPTRRETRCPAVIHQTRSTTRRRLSFWP